MGVNDVAGIVLAAGSSTRMGAPKQLLQVGIQNLLDRALSQALESELHRVVLVLGYKALEIEQSLSFINRQHPKLRIVHNERHAEGISSSIIAGLRAVEHDYEQVMFLLADMPHVTAKLINTLIRTYLDSGSPLGAVRTANRRTHPVIISRRFFQELHTLHGDIGARDLFLTHPDEICLAEPKEPFDDMDIDTLADYAELRSSLGEKGGKDSPKS